MDQLPEWLASTLASDATEGRHVLPSWIQPLRQDARVVGRAFVVQASQDDNQSVVQAVQTPPPAGSVLVVGGHSTSRTSTVGGLYALELQNYGVLGLVTDGLIRDAKEIRALNLQVWCRGTTPTASTKKGPGSVGGTTLVGGVVVRDGDWVIADDDGVVIWPAEEVEALMAKAQAKLETDNARLARLQQMPIRA